MIPYTCSLELERYITHDIAIYAINTIFSEIRASIMQASHNYLSQKHMGTLQ